MQHGDAAAHEIINCFRQHKKPQTLLKLGLHEAKILLVVALADNRFVLNALRLDIILQSQVWRGALMNFMQGILVHIPTSTNPLSANWLQTTASSVVTW